MKFCTKCGLSVNETLASADFPGYTYEKGDLLCYNCWTKLQEKISESRRKLEEWKKSKSKSKSKKKGKKSKKKK